MAAQPSERQYEYYEDEAVGVLEDALQQEYRARDYYQSSSLKRPWKKETKGCWSGWRVKSRSTPSSSQSTWMRSRGAWPGSATSPAPNRSSFKGRPAPDRLPATAMAIGT